MALDETITLAAQEDTAAISMTSEGGGDTLLGQSNIGYRLASPTLELSSTGSDKDDYVKKLISTLKSPATSAGPSGVGPLDAMKGPPSETGVEKEGASSRASGPALDVIENNSLLDGFVLLRLAQLINFDVHYIRMPHDTAASKSGSRQKLTRDIWQVAGNDVELGQREARDTSPSEQEEAASERAPGMSSIDYSARLNPLKFYTDRFWLLNQAWRLLKTCLSLLAIIISVDKTISTGLLCLLSRPDIQSRPGNIGIAYETSDVTMSWIVLNLVNLSSMFIMFSTIFNGHLLWELLSQRIFLISGQFQRKTIASLLAFVYLEYIVNISFINYLFGWPFESSSGRLGSSGSQHDIHSSYSFLSRMEIFVTEKDEQNVYLDILLTIFQFARGIIRISPYITINYVITCLNEHIKTVRNQVLLTDSLKRRPKLRLALKSSRAKLADSAARRPSKLHADPSPSQQATTSRKKRVVFVTDTSGASPAASELLAIPSQQQVPLAPLSPNQLGVTSSTSAEGDSSSKPDAVSLVAAFRSGSPISLVSSNPSMADWSVPDSKRPEAVVDGGRAGDRGLYLNRIRDFNELESYVTNLYIFTGRINRLMNRLGLTIFFIVHNLVITCTLIVPEAIRGGAPMVLVIRVLVVIIGILPFISGQTFNGQLGQLSKQIDRIIILQQFTGRKRDNLVRIRELLHDIRVNCSELLNFNLETGIKYLVIAFASAFFIEQEDYKLTRRH